jgi:hypothetical protein
LQSIRSGLAAVYDLSFEAESGSATVWLDLAGEARKVVLELDASEYSPRVLECLYGDMGASTTRLLTWMTETIDFTQMWNTVKVLTAMWPEIAAWQKSATDHFSTLVTPDAIVGMVPKVVSGFGEVVGALGPWNSIPQLVGLVWDAPAGAISEAWDTTFDMAALVSSPAGRWVFERVLYSQPYPLHAGNARDDFDDFEGLADVEALLSEFGSGPNADMFKSALSSYAAPWREADPSAFGLMPAATGMSALATIIKPAMASCATVAPHLANLLKNSSPAINKAMSGPAGSSPEIDAIFVWLQLRAGVSASEAAPPSMLQLTLLTLALPANLAYRRFTGDYPFPLGERPLIPSPPNWSASVAAQDAEINFDLCIFFQILAALAQLIWIPVNFVMDAASTGWRPDTFWLSWPDWVSHRMMKWYLGFEIVAFAFIGLPVWWGYLGNPGWQQREEAGWWAQYGVQMGLIAIDVFLVFGGHLIPPLTDVILVWEGWGGALIVAVLNLLMLALGGWTYFLSSRQSADLLWMINRVGVYVPGIAKAWQGFRGSVDPWSRWWYTPACIIQAILELGGNLLGAGTEIAWLAMEFKGQPALPPTTELNDAKLNVAYVQDPPFTAVAGWRPYDNWHVTKGELPEGLELQPSVDKRTCVIGGTPTRYTNEPSKFTIGVNDYFAPSKLWITEVTLSVVQQ